MLMANICTWMRVANTTTLSCAQHYHERNGTLCANAACSEEQRGIEGPCVSLVGEESGNGGRCKFAIKSPSLLTLS